MPMKSKGTKAVKLEPAPPPDMSPVYTVVETRETMIVVREGVHPVEQTFEVESGHGFALGSKVRFVDGELFDIADIDAAVDVIEPSSPADDGSKDHS